ncbi:MAG: hypothetical protein J5965_28960 [Aeriscardovia sp.]|nr:hypothetical protein [Aeriscardovia sp.]
MLSNGEDAVSQLDLDIYHSHIPEYEKIFEDLINSKQLYQSNGRWYGKFSDGTKKVEPDEYIVAHSKAFKNNGWQYDGTNNQRAMTNDEYKSILKDGGIGRLKWTTDDSEQVGVFADEGFRKGGRTVRTIVGNVPKYKWVHRPTKYARELRPNSTSGVEYSSNVPYKNTVGNYTLFGNDVPIKSLRGNNGDFSKLYRGIYKALVPTVIGGTYIGGLEND